MHWAAYQLPQIYKLSDAVGGADSHRSRLEGIKPSLSRLKERWRLGFEQVLSKVLLCLWKEPGVHRRHGISFESDEEFSSYLQQ